jgi:hypothetical protein
MAQPQNRVSRKLKLAGCFAQLTSSFGLARSVQTGPFAGRPVPQSRPGADRISSARGDRTRSRPSKVPSRKASLDERDSLNVTENGTYVKLVTSIVTTGHFLRRGRSGRHRAFRQ